MLVDVLDVERVLAEIEFIEMGASVVIFTISEDCFCLVVSAEKELTNRRIVSHFIRLRLCCFLH